MKCRAKLKKHYTKIKTHSDPIPDDKYLKTKTKSYIKKITTNLHGNEPKKKLEYCFQVVQQLLSTDIFRRVQMQIKEKEIKSLSKMIKKVLLLVMLMKKILKKIQSNL